MARLSGRSAIVTGGAKGIGAHYSRALAAEGARVMIADIADGSALAHELAAAHGVNSVASMVADVSDEAAVAALVAATVERFGRIDVLVNNAALYAPLAEQKVTEIDAALFDRVMAVNLRGPFLIARARRARHPRQHAGAGLHAQRHRAGGESRPRRHRARARGGAARAQARPASPGSARRAGLPRFRRQRLRHRPDHHGGRRQRQHLTLRTDPPSCAHLLRASTPLQPW
jgi:NAD(P)-dependent dehydrogenase (short-subunit alcohol dehydrogenase family)